MKDGQLAKRAERSRTAGLTRRAFLTGGGMLVACGAGNASLHCWRGDEIVVVSGWILTRADLAGRSPDFG